MLNFIKRFCKAIVGLIFICGGWIPISVACILIYIFTGKDIFSPFIQYIGPV